MEKSNIHEKIKLLTGNGMWHTQETEDLPSVHLSDGPHGLRKQEEKERQNNVSLVSTCYPTASALACSWDVTRRSGWAGRLRRKHGTRTLPCCWGRAST